MIKLISIFLLSLSLTTVAYAHSGGKNGGGCHTQSADGGYHCHDGKGKKRYVSPYQRSIKYHRNHCLVSKGKYRCGYAESTCNVLRGKYGGYCTSVRENSVREKADIDKLIARIMQKQKKYDDKPPFPWE